MNTKPISNRRLRIGDRVIIPANPTRRSLAWSPDKCGKLATVISDPRDDEFGDVKIDIDGDRDNPWWVMTGGWQVDLVTKE